MIRQVSQRQGPTAAAAHPAGPPPMTQKSTFSTRLSGSGMTSSGTPKRDRRCATGRSCLLEGGRIHRPPCTRTADTPALIKEAKRTISEQPPGPGSKSQCCSRSQVPRRRLAALGRRSQLTEANRSSPAEASRAGGRSQSVNLALTRVSRGTQLKVDC